MARKVFVVGVGMTKFEKPGSKSWDYPDMAKEAGEKALADAGIPYAQVEQAVVGYCYGDSTCGQRAVYQLGLTGIPVYNVNNNCSTGSTALFMGKQLVSGGIADCILALGFEKMEKGSLGVKFNDRTNPLDKQFELMVSLRGFAAAAPSEVGQHCSLVSGSYTIGAFMMSSSVYSSWNCEFGLLTECLWFLRPILANCSGVLP